MKTTLYYIGQPVTTVDFTDPEHRIAGPIGLLDECREIARKHPTEEIASRAMCIEYIEIVRALSAMGIRFKMILSHKDKYDPVAATYCLARLRCDVEVFPERFPQIHMTYPRDMTTVIPGCTLLNDRGKTAEHGELGIEGVIESPFGEGGRVLRAGKIMIVPEYSIRNDVPSVTQATTLIEINPLLKAGMRVGLCPPFILAEQKKSGAVSYGFNDHLDRIAALIEGKDGRPHLIIDHLAATVSKGGSSRNAADYINAANLASMVRGEYRHLGITVHVAPSSPIPYALNLIQFEGGKVLMTGGAPELRSLVESLVGNGMVTTTSIPIKCFPTFKFAGIRCMISEAPIAFLGRGWDFARIAADRQARSRHRDPLSCHERVSLFALPCGRKNRSGNVPERCAFQTTDE